MNFFLCSPSKVSSRCESSVVPSVAVTSACVSPRVNSAEPWVRGSTPTSIEIAPNFVERAMVRANPLLRHLLAEEPLAQRFVVVRQLLLRRRRVRIVRNLRLQLVLDLLHQHLAFELRDAPSCPARPSAALPTFASSAS